MIQTEYTYTAINNATESETRDHDSSTGDGGSADAFNASGTQENAAAASGRPLMEKVIDDDRVNINHIVVPAGGAVPTHVSNSWVHQIVVRGTLSLSLEDEAFTDHPTGAIVAVPFNRKMVIENHGTDTLEFFVVKAPNPRDMPAVKELRNGSNR